MRRLAALILISLAVAVPAAAGGKITVVKQAPAGLRGPQSATNTAAASPIPAALAQAWQAPVPQASSGDAMQCRASCAQTYYFCAAGGDEDCAGRWSQCTASCSATATYQPYQPSF